MKPDDVKPCTRCGQTTGKLPLAAMCDRCADDLVPPGPGAPEMKRGWLRGTPMDPEAVPAEPRPFLPGVSYLPDLGVGVLINGPTGGGRSAAVEASHYDAAIAGLPSLYLGHEISEDEFNARSALFARARGHAVDQALRAKLALARYLDLSSTIIEAFEHPGAWVEEVVAEQYRILTIDPLSAVESALGLNFTNDNHDYVRFYDRVAQPLVARGVICQMVENVGHSADARDRAKGASAKQDRADLTFTCSPSPAGLVLKAKKVRSMRSPVRRDDTWLFRKDQYRFERVDRDHTAGEAPAKPSSPTPLMSRISDHLDAHPGDNVNAIKRAMGGKADYVAKALAKLVQEGYVEPREHGQKRGHHNVRAFTEQGDKPGPNSRDSVTDTELKVLSPTESHETPDDTGPGTGSQPSPTQSREPAARTESPRSRYVVRDSRESVEAGPRNLEAVMAPGASTTPVLVAVADPDETRLEAWDGGQPIEATEVDWLETFGVPYDSTPVWECAYPESHRRLGVDWLAPSGRVTCGCCHPRPKAVAA